MTISSLESGGKQKIVAGTSQQCSEQSWPDFPDGVGHATHEVVLTVGDRCRHGSAAAAAQHVFSMDEQREWDPPWELELQDEEMAK